MPAAVGSLEGNSFALLLELKHQVLLQSTSYFRDRKSTFVRNAPPRPSPAPCPKTHEP